MFTVPEVSAHVLHHPLHPRLVFGGAHPGRVGDEPDMPGVVEPPLGSCGLTASAAAITGLRLSGISTANTPPKNSHAASHPAITATRVCE